MTSISNSKPIIPIVVSPLAGLPQTARAEDDEVSIIISGSENDSNSTSRAQQGAAAIAAAKEAKLKEEKYRKALSCLLDSDFTTTLQRQAEYITEPEQKIPLAKSILASAVVVGGMTCAGVKAGEIAARKLNLSPAHKPFAMAIGGGAGFLAGARSCLVVGSGFIESTASMKKWKAEKSVTIIADLMKEEFRNDPIWSQFICPISQSPMINPYRTPDGKMFDYDSMLEAKEQIRKVKDIYNKEVSSLNLADPQVARILSYDNSAYSKDEEASIVIYRRFRWLADQKLKNKALSAPIEEFFLKYKESLATPLEATYTAFEKLIRNKRKAVRQKNNLPEKERDQIEKKCTQDAQEFHTLFGQTPAGEINWNSQGNWIEILNSRWKATHRP